MHVYLILYKNIRTTKLNLMDCVEIHDRAMYYIINVVSTNTPPLNDKLSSIGIPDILCGHIGKTLIVVDSIRSICM